jgi:hypothetical protein
MFPFRGVVIPDLHVPLHDEEAISCCRKAICLVEPQVAIFLGDIGEWSSVSRWMYAKKKRPPVEYIIPQIEEDAKAVNDILDKFDASFTNVGVKRKIVLIGNHEVWLENFVTEHPYLTQYLPPAIMRLNERGYEVYGHGEYLQIGELNFYHGGHHVGVNHTRQHAINLGANVMYGHNHDVSRSSLPNLNGVHSAFSIGCLKKVQGEENKWLKGRKVNWGHSFAIVDWFVDGTFRADIVDITGGKTFVWGEMIDGK